VTTFKNEIKDTQNVEGNTKMSQVRGELSCLIQTNAKVILSPLSLFLSSSSSSTVFSEFNFWFLKFTYNQHI